MRYKQIFFLVLAVIASMDASAQRRRQKVEEKPSKPDTALVVKSYIDSLAVLRRQLD